jgi:hypothetical protein
MARAFVFAAPLSVVAFAVALPASATATAPALVAHGQYGGLTAKKDAFVNFLTGTSTTIAASAVNTAPELLRSNINLQCANKAQVNPGMPGITLKMTAGHYSFSTTYVRKGVKETYPGSGTVTLSVTISGTVESSTTLKGTVKVTGPGGCAISSQAYTATLGKK